MTTATERPKAAVRTAPPLWRRLVFLLPGAAALLAGLDGGLVLLGVPAPVEANVLPDRHGMLMVIGFLATLIALERAVALKHPLGYAAPALLGLGALVLVLAPSPTPGTLLMADGCIAFVALLAALHRRSHDLVVAVGMAGAALAACACLLWLRVDVATLLPFLVGFIVLTICAERVELARLALARGGTTVLTLAAAAISTTTAATLVWPEVATRLLGLATAALVGWLAVHDVARKMIHQAGLPRFSAASLLLGYVWLAVTSLTWLVGGPTSTDAAYDVVVHAAFLGFAMSMVLAHAPVILPAVLRRPLPYRPVMWLPLLLLHAGLVVRLGLGDALGHRALWQLGGTLNVVALLGLIATSVFSAAAGAAATRRRRAA